MEIDPDNGRCDVVGTAILPNTVNTNGFEASTPVLALPPKNARGGAFSAAKSMKHGKYRCGGPVRGVREQHVGA